MPSSISHRFVFCIATKKLKSSKCIAGKLEGKVVTTTLVNAACCIEIKFKEDSASDLDLLNAVFQQKDVENENE